MDRIVYKRDWRRPIAEPRISRCIELALARGFKVDQGFSNLVCGWVRLYNTSRARDGKSYNAGAMGIQISWRYVTNADGWAECVATLHTWKVG